MTPPPSVETLIAHLLTLPASEREKYLEQACLERPDFRERLPEIREAIATAAAPFETGVDAMQQMFQSALDCSGEETPGTRIGPYKLLQKIGEGGFGTVWMAEQLEPINRRVALKIIKLGMDTKEVIARFEAERQAIAMMDHANIARVFDAGATGTGRPYFAMELVRGVPITRYCDEQRLPTEDRLKLFVAVCHAVQHAHQKGIIHRDLKPSNILVTLHDGIPVPKIIDFGIAKATSSRLTEKTLFTQFHAFIGTPAYTSPEQMEMSGLDIDTRSDIYSLGVLLYELLTGQPPFDSDSLVKSGLDAMRRTIREVEPPRPSQKLGTFSDKIRTTVVHQRRTDAVKLSILLNGDLDWIVMHCLEKDRTRRYETANSLGADIRNFLANEPVSARPPSTGYRLRKLIRRHRIGFIAGTGVAVSLIAALIMLSVLLVREQSAHDRETALRAQADAKAQQARLAGEKSDQVALFMTDMLQGVGPSKARGRDTTMLRGILDTTAKRLETELKDQPEVAADLRDTLGVVYSDLGQYAVAEKFLSEAVAARRQLNGNESAELATSLDNYGTALNLQGRPEAGPAVLEALAIRRKLFGDKHPLVATTLSHLSRTAATPLSNFDEWIAIREKVLALRLEILGPEHPDVAESLFSMGVVAYQRNNLAESTRLTREALAMRRKLLGDDHPILVENLLGLGWTLSEDEQWPEAEAAYREALRLATKIMPEHPSVTIALLRLAGVQPPVVRDDTVLALARAAVTAQSARLGPTAPAVAVSSLALSILLSGRSETADESRVLARDAQTALEAQRRSGTAFPGDILLDMNFYAMRRMFHAGMPAQAFVMADQMLRYTRSGLGPSPAQFPSSLLMVAMVHFYSGRPTEARTFWEEIIPLVQKGPGAARAPALPHLSMFAAANRETGRLAEAERLLRDGLSLVQQNLGSTGVPDPSVATVYCELGLTLNAQSRFAEAQGYFQQSFEHHDRAAREKSPRPLNRFWIQMRPRAEAESGLGQALAGQGKFADAEPVLLNAFASLEAQREKLGGDRNKLLREAAGRIVECYTAWGKPDKAAEWRNKPLSLTSRP